MPSKVNAKVLTSMRFNFYKAMVFGDISEAKWFCSAQTLAWISGFSQTFADKIYGDSG